jgi:hypothetical protein
MGKGGVARATFWPHGRFNLNAHGDAAAAAEIDEWLPGKLIETSRSRLSWHSPVVLDRRDLGVGDEEWVDMREACDINLTWSSAIRQGDDGKPYAYFCEVAAALDGVRGENAGIPAEPGWWRLKMPAFARQVERCCDRGCGVPLRRLGHRDREDTYDSSPSWRAALANRRGSVVVDEHSAMPAPTDRPTDYQAHRTTKPGVAS